MISYELALGLSLVPVVMLTRSFSLADIVQAQARLPFILVQPLAFIIFFISAVAEIKRIPFDLPEAENELGAMLQRQEYAEKTGLPVPQPGQVPRVRRPPAAAASTPRGRSSHARPREPAPQPGAGPSGLRQPGAGRSRRPRLTI